VTVVVALSTTLCDTHIRCEHNMRTFNHIMVKLIEFCMIPACQYIMSFGCSCIKFHKNFFVGIKFALHMMSLYAMTYFRCEHEIIMVAFIWSESTSLSMKHLGEFTRHVYMYTRA
jgi:hypothetical protein